MGEIPMPEFLQKAIEKAKARPGKLGKNLEELRSLRNGEGELAKVVGEGYGQIEPDSDSNAVFEESGRRSAALMKDEDVQSAIMEEANKENRQKGVEEELRELNKKRRCGAAEFQDVLEEMGLFQDVRVFPPEFSENKNCAQVQVTMKPEEEYKAAVSQDKKYKYEVGSFFGGDQLSGEKIESYGYMMFLLAHFMREYDVPYLELEIKGHAGDGSEIEKRQYFGAPRGEKYRAIPFSQKWLEEREETRENDRWLKNEEMRKALEEKKARENEGEAKPDEA